MAGSWAGVADAGGLGRGASVAVAGEAAGAADLSAAAFRPGALVGLPPRSLRAWTRRPPSNCRTPPPGDPRPRRPSSNPGLASPPPSSEPPFGHRSAAGVPAGAVVAAAAFVAGDFSADDFLAHRPSLGLIRAHSGAATSCRTFVGRRLLRPPPSWRAPPRRSVRLLAGAFLAPPSWSCDFCAADFFAADFVAAGRPSRWVGGDLRSRLPRSTPSRLGAGRRLAGRRRGPVPVPAGAVAARARGGGVAALLRRDDLLGVAAVSAAGSATGVAGSAKGSAEAGRQLGRRGRRAPGP